MACGLDHYGSHLPPIVLHVLYKSWQNWHAGFQRSVTIVPSKVHLGPKHFVRKVDHQEHLLFPTDIL